ncbi:hypothetical protein [Variovorax boronicumulans]|uniref:hypothetical protein n=1 Tax=Variovorax boronicumulans TaxID=436515 RepID=UPI00142D41BB|nr:hypothetical protein [Variovorax boronicumulans]
MPQFQPLALLLLSLFLPKSLAQYFVPLALVAILYQGRKNISIFFSQKFFALSALAGPLLVALFVTPGDALRFISIIILIVAFPFSGVKTAGLSRVALVCFFYALIFQVGILFDISFFDGFKSKFYPADFTWTQGDFEATDFGFRSVRAAGLFYNPNVAALMSLFSYVIYAVSRRPPFSGKWHLIILALTGLSLILAGSRTYLVAFALITMLNLFKTKISKLGVFVLAVIFLSGFVYEYVFQDFSNTSGSVHIKNQILFEYINSTISSSGGWLPLLFGGEYSIQFDNDIGYILGDGASLVCFPWRCSRCFLWLRLNPRGEFCLSFWEQ